MSSSISSSSSSSFSQEQKIPEVERQVDFSKLPNDVWHEILSFKDLQSIANLKGTSRTYNQLVDFHEEFVIQSLCKASPMIHFVVEKFPEHTDKMERLVTRLIYLSGIVKDLNSVHSVNEFRWIPRPTLNRSRYSSRDGLRYVMELSREINPDACFVVAAMENNEEVFKTFDLNLIQRKSIDEAAYFFLKNQNAIQFKKILPNTRVFPENNPFARQTLTRFLIKSAEANLGTVFNDLLELNKPFNHNEVLVRAAIANNGEAIARLLTSNNLVFNEQFQNNQFAITWSLQLALMEAAYYNNQNAFDAILENRPNQMIDRQILEFVRDQIASYNPQIHRTHPYLQVLQDHNNREGMIARLNQEIAARFPEEPMPVVNDEEVNIAPPVVNDNEVLVLPVDNEVVHHDEEVNVAPPIANDVPFIAPEEAIRRNKEFVLKAVGILVLAIAVNLFMYYNS